MGGLAENPRAAAVAAGLSKLPSPPERTVALNCCGLWGMLRSDVRGKAREVSGGKGGCEDPQPIPCATPVHAHARLGPDVCRASRS